MPSSPVQVNGGNAPMWSNDDRHRATRRSRAASSASRRSMPSAILARLLGLPPGLQPCSQVRIRSIHVGLTLLMLPPHADCGE